MVYNNRDYPHPVLGVNDSVEGQFNVRLSIKPGKDTIRIEPIYNIDNIDIKELVEDQKAEFICQVYCNSTMYREIFKFSNAISKPIAIPTIRLRDEVELHFFVCASNDIPNYTNSKSHVDYGANSFYLNKGDFLAYGGKAIFNANKRPEELKSISSFMQIEQYDQQNGPIKNFYDGSKIIVQLPKSDFEKYLEVAGNKYSEQLLHSSVVLPALMDAIDKVNNEGEEFGDNTWFKILSKLLEENGDGNNSPLIAGQRILDNPLNRTFNTIDSLLYSED